MWTAASAPCQRNSQQSASERPKHFKGSGNRFATAENNCVCLRVSCSEYSQDFGTILVRRSITFRKALRPSNSSPAYVKGRIKAHCNANLCDLQGSLKKFR